MKPVPFHFYSRLLLAGTIGLGLVVTLALLSLAWHTMVTSREERFGQQI